MGKKTKNSSKSSRAPASNTKRQPSPLWHWCMTIPVTEERTVEYIQEKLKKVCKRYSFQKELGEKTGFLHYQVYLQLRVKKRMAFLHKLFNDETLHCEKSKGWDASYMYCIKENTRVEGPWEFDEGPYPGVKTLEPEQLYPWQKEIITIIEKEPDDRKIYWYWEEKGGAGKSVFTKYLAIKYNAGLIGGKKNDILYLASQMNRLLYVVDLPRTIEEFVPYESIEYIKNGIYPSGKYESVQVIRNCPHIICFANFEPDYTKLSNDRWLVQYIGGAPLSRRAGFDPSAAGKNQASQRDASSALWERSSPQSGSVIESNGLSNVHLTLNFN